MQITREDAVRSLLALDFKMAADWSVERLEGRLGKLHEMGVDEVKIEDEDVEAFLVEVMEALDKGEAIEVVEEAEATVEQVAEEAQAESQEEAVIGVVNEPVEEKAKPKPKPKPKPKTKPRKGKAVKKETPKEKPLTRGEPGPKVGETDPKGIRSIRNRLFCAGAVLAKHGIQSGFTDELIDEVDKLCGKPNKKASKSQLGLAWHVINGYLNGNS